MRMAVRTAHQCTATREADQALLIASMRLKLHVLGSFLRLR